MKKEIPFQPYDRDTELSVYWDQSQQGMFINGNLISDIKERNGIVSIENGSVGIGHSCHPNIDVTGSLTGMRQRYQSWREGKIVRAGGFYYNKSSIVISDPLDLLAYHMEYNGYRIKKSVLDWCKSHPMSKAVVTLSKIER